MQQPNFIRFEIEQRKHSPNAIIGIHEVNIGGCLKEKRIFITAAGAALGKELGDKLVIQIKECLEREYLQTIIA